LQQLGWSDGRNVQINYRAGGGNSALIRKYAEELVALSPELLFSSGAATVAPLLHVTRTVPIIFAGVVDPGERQSSGMPPFPLGPASSVQSSQWSRH
jgi:putative ABC transport system substrate-binding protein